MKIRIFAPFKVHRRRIGQILILIEKILEAEGILFTI